MFNYNQIKFVVYITFVVYFQRRTVNFSLKSSLKKKVCTNKKKIIHKSKISQKEG